MVDVNSVIIKPVLTEKADRLESKVNQVTFKVNPIATKQQIKEAVKALFDVRVVSVNTMVVKGKRRRVRGAFGFESDWKKAVVKLHPEDSLEFPSVG